MRECVGIVAVILALATSAGAARVQVGDGVPFTAEQLTAAVSLRTGAPPPAMRVTVGERPGRLVLVIAGVRRAVDVDGLVGSPAARRVALAALDLLELRRHASVLPPLVVALPPAIADIEVPRAPEPPPLALTRSASPPRLTVAGLVGNAGVGAELSASFRLIGAVRGVVGAGLSTAGGADHLRISHLPLVLGLERRWQRAALTLGVQGRGVVSPHHIAIDDGARRLSHTAVRFGAGALIFGEVALGRAVRARLAGQLTAYATRKQYLVGGREVLATARFGAGVIAGLSFDLEGDR